LVSLALSACSNSINVWYQKATDDCFNAWGHGIYDQYKMVYVCQKNAEEKPIFIRKYSNEVK